MCGIVAFCLCSGSESSLRPQLLELSRKLRHRGPDWSGVAVQKTPRGLTLLAHERLSIIDPVSGAQPLFNVDRNLALAANGEIYNHLELRRDHLSSVVFRTKSDCECIVHLFEKIGVDTFSMLDGDFAFVISNETTGDFVAARDPIGIVPLYMGRAADGSVVFASEMKALNSLCISFDAFPPGHYYDSRTDQLVRYHCPVWITEGYLPKSAPSFDLSLIRNALIKAVNKRLMADVPFGVLLSGGLDSSLVASITCRLLAEKLKSGSDEEPWSTKLHTFSIGLTGSPDLAAAQKVADFLGTKHYNLTFTVQDGLDALSDVIYHLETYDVTTVRASTPMYLMSRIIKSIGVKMVLSGEGADEIFGGYLYFHKAPNPFEFHKECVRKVQALYSYDCLRANKSTAAWGVEARVPFLDRDFLDLVLTIDPAEKMIGNHDSEGRYKLEKYILRKSFDCKENPYLPDEVLWRQKEQFSDGVGYGWIDSLRENATCRVSDAMMTAAKHRFPINTPTTKEAYFYRSLFEHHYPQTCAIQTVPGGPSVACSSAIAVAWDASWSLKTNQDPSGRAVVGVHGVGVAGVTEPPTTIESPTKKQKQ